MTAFTIVTPEEDILGGVSVPVSVPVMNKASHPAQAPPGGKERKAGEQPRGQSLQALCCPYRKSTILLHPRKEERKKKHYVRHYVIQDSGGDSSDLPPHTAPGRLHTAWIMLCTGDGQLHERV